MGNRETLNSVSEARALLGGLLLPLGVRGDPLPCLGDRHEHDTVRVIERDLGERLALFGFGLSFGGSEAFGLVLCHGRALRPPTDANSLLTTKDEGKSRPLTFSDRTVVLFFFS